VRCQCSVAPNLGLPTSTPLSQILRGCGQVIFLEDAMQGLLVLLALAWADPMLAAYGLLGSAVATLLSCITGHGGADLGLHGYNSVLIGCAFSIFFPSHGLSDPEMAITIALGAAAAWAAGCVLACIYPVGLGPQWTYGFNIVVIGSLWYAQRARPSAGGPALSPPSSPPTDMEMLLSPLTGVSQIFLVNDAISGFVLLCAIGMGVGGRPDRSTLGSAAYALSGSAIGAAIGMAVVPNDLRTVADGLWGFNACLTSLSVAVCFPRVSWGQLGLSLIGAAASALLGPWVLSPLIERAFGTASFTLPFCITATCTYALGKGLQL